MGKKKEGGKRGFLKIAERGKNADRVIRRRGGRDCREGGVVDHTFPRKGLEKGEGGERRRLSRRPQKTLIEAEGGGKRPDCRGRGPNKRIAAKEKGASGCWGKKGEATLGVTVCSWETGQTVYKKNGNFTQEGKKKPLASTGEKFSQKGYRKKTWVGPGLFLKKRKKKGSIMDRGGTRRRKRVFPKKGRQFSLTVWGKNALKGKKGGMLRSPEKKKLGAL